MAGLVAGLMVMALVLVGIWFSWWPCARRLRANVAVLVIVVVGFAFLSGAAHVELDAHTHTREHSSDYREKMTEPTTESPGLPYALFYNAFVPSDKGKGAIEHAFKIIRSQLSDIALSYAASHPKPLNVYYNSIGSKMLNDTTMREMCVGNLRCQQLNHYDKGSEEVTLAEARRYCLAHRSHRVIYVHNKGSFHPSKSQDNWRYHGTAAVTSSMCLNPVDETCNACSLVWTLFPFFHPPGNFWTAQCSYIAKILPPETYAERLQTFLLNEIEPNGHDFTYYMFMGDQQITPRVVRKHPAEFGIGRFAMENWVGSHPHIIPCDISAAPSIDHWKDKKRDTAEFVWSMFPRRNFSSGWSYVHLGRLAEVIVDETRRVNEYYLLPGILARAKALYQARPSDTSWMWSLYP